MSKTHETKEFRFAPRRLQDVIEEVCRERGDPLPVDVCAEIEEAAIGWGFPRVAVVPGEDEARSLRDFLDEAYFGASVGASPSMAVARALLAAGWTRGGGREAALDAAVAAFLGGVTVDGRCRVCGENPCAGTCDVSPLRAALALTPTDAAQAVRELVEAAEGATELLGGLAGDDADLQPYQRAWNALRAALRPFGGAGDADDA